MSQLERALRKARAEENDSRSESGGAVRPIANAAFVSAWSFEDAAERAQPRPAHIEPVVALPHPQPQPPVLQPHTHAHPRQRETVRKAEAAPQFRNFSAEIQAKLVVGAEAPPNLREQFGKIAAVLYRMRETQPIKVMMIVSAVPGEGKSLTAMNMALTLSEAYKANVLLVDADLRRPTIHRLLDVPNGSGLKEALASDSAGPLASVSVTPQLRVVTAGSADVDPMGALISDRMRRLVDEATETFDWIILDTPPVTLIPDAHLLASMSDVALLVVEAGSTSYQLAKEAVDIIGRERVVGVVLNKVAARPGTYSHYHYYSNSTET
jgi:protein-tyrosine kinase